jgi:hypothetical protein
VPVGGFPHADLAAVPNAAPAADLRRVRAVALERAALLRLQAGAESR